MQVHIVGIQLLLGVPGVVVAHGDRHVEILAHEVLEDGAVGSGGDVVHAGGAGAQRQVGRVRAQDHGVLDGDHVVRVVRAAAGAEDLHDEDLRIGGLAHHADGLFRIDEFTVELQVAVGRCDAGHVGAVLLLGVALVVGRGVVVHVVVGVGDLGTLVDTGAVEAGGGDVLGGHQLVQVAVLFDGVEEGLLIEGLVLIVQAGVDDGDLPAGAGVFAAVADHVSGVHGLRGYDLAGVGCGGLVLLLELDVSDAVELGDGLDLAVGDPGGDHVAGQRDVPLDLQGLSVQDLCRDPAGQLVLLLLEQVTVGSGVFVLGDALDFVAEIQRGGRLENDGDSHPVVEPVGRRFRGSLCRVLFHGPELGNVQSLRVDLHKFQTLVCGRFGFGGIGRNGRNRQTGHERERQEQGNHALPKLLHVVKSFL